MMASSKITIKKEKIPTVLAARLSNEKEKKMAKTRKKALVISIQPQGSRWLEMAKRPVITTMNAIRIKMTERLCFL